MSRTTKLLGAAVFAVVFASVMTAAAQDNGLRTVESTVERVDQAQNTATLVNGMTLTGAPNIPVWELQPNEDVTITYQETQGGQGAIRAFWIDSGPGGHSD